MEKQVAAEAALGQGNSGRSQPDSGVDMSVERMLAEIALESTAIALDTTALRKSLVVISAEIGKWAARAGVKYGDEEQKRWWAFPPSPPGTVTGRLIIAKDQDGRWGVHTELTGAHPSFWDGSNWVGWENPFSAEAYACGLAHLGTFETASRFILENAAKNLIAFLGDYCEELKRRHIRYADLRAKMEKIVAVLEE